MAQPMLEACQEKIVYQGHRYQTVDLQERLSKPLTIGFDARLVLETLKAFDCDNVGISLEGPKMPMIIEAEDSDFKTVVLPVAI